MAGGNSIQLSQFPTFKQAIHKQMQMGGLFVYWSFIQQMLPQLASAAVYPALAAYSELAEALPAFKAAPHGAATYILAD